MNSHLEGKDVGVEDEKRDSLISNSEPNTLDATTRNFVAEAENPVAGPSNNMVRRKGKGVKKEEIEEERDGVAVADEDVVMVQRAKRVKIRKVRNGDVGKLKNKVDTPQA